MSSFGGSSSISDIPLDANSLSETDKRELQQFIATESQKASLQDNIHTLTAMCFKKCVPGKIAGNTLDRNEEPCMLNCVQRFMDANNLVLKHLERLRTSA